MNDGQPDDVRALYGELASLPECEWDDALLARDVAPEVADEVLELLRAGRSPAPIVARLAPDAKRTPLLRPRVEGYRVGDEIGDGATGRVFAGTHIESGRRVAIKVLRHLRPAGEETKRFRREVRILERLDHPSIAGFVESTAAETPVGAAPALVMELVDGQPIHTHCDVHDLDDDQRITLIASVLDALVHAHERGVIHRDLKPANVLVLRDHQPVVVDFGVAHLASPGEDDSLSRTRDGDLLGTLAYMAPEQASRPSSGSGERDQPVDPRCDVYSAGALLFELLTGQHPIRLQNASLSDAIHRLSREDARGLEELRPELAGDLSTILARSLAKDPDSRYPSAAALAADLRRFLARDAIVAQPFGAWELARRFARRHRVLTAAACAAFLGLAIGALGLALGLVRARAAQTVAERAAGETNEILGAVVDVLHAPFVEKRGHLVTVSELLDEVSPKLLAARHLSHRTALAVHRPIGESLRSLGRPSEARQHLARAVSSAEEIGLPPSVLAELVAERAEAEREMDDAEAALVSLGLARDLRVRAFGEASSEVCSTDLRRAFTLAALGQYDKALALAKRTHLTISEGSGLESIELDRAEDVWGGILLEKRSFKDGETHLRRAIAGFRIRGTEEELATATHNLGVLLRLASDFDAGLVASEEALELNILAHGPEHLRTHFSRGSLGLARAHNFDPEGALAELELASEGIRRILGDRHEETLIQELSRADVLYTLGRAQEGLELSGRVAEIHLADGRRNNASLTAFNAHAQHLMKAGRLEESLQWLGQARDVTEETHERESAFAITLDTNRAHLLVGLGRTGEALELLEDAHARLALSTDSADPDRMLVEANLGRALSAAGRHDESLEHLEKAVALTRGYLAEGQLPRLLVLKLLAEAQSRGERVSEARETLSMIRSELEHAPALRDQILPVLDDLERGLGESDVELTQ